MGFADSLLMLLASRALCGVMAGNISAAFAYVSDRTDAANRTRGMGLVGAAFGLGFIIGPAIGGVLAGADAASADFQTPSFAAAALSFTALILGLFTLKESLSAETRAARAGKPHDSIRSLAAEIAGNRRLALWVGLTFMVTFILAGMETTFAMWTERSFGWGPKPNGYLLAFVGVLNASIQGGLIGRLRGWFGEWGLVVQGAAVLAVGCFFFPLSATPAVLVVVMIAMSYGFSVITPALNSLTSLEANPERLGGILGLSRSASISARVVGPLVAGTLFQFFGKDAPYFFSAFLMAGLLMLILVLRQKMGIPRSTEGLDAATGAARSTEAPPPAQSSTKSP